MRTELRGGKHLRIKGHYVSHLHFIEITATDFSGRRSTFGRSIFWIHPQYKDYDKRRFPSSAYPTDKNKKLYVDLHSYFHASEYFPPHLREGEDGRYTKVFAGVLVYE